MTQLYKGREIKFRAILNKEAHSNKQYGNWEKTIYFTLEDLMRGKVTFVYPEHWQFDRWTGLKDKNGKEIYEGDIIRNYSNRAKKSLVEWDNKLAMFIGFDSFEIGRYEIIGNIWENGDLLEYINKK